MPSFNAKWVWAQISRDWKKLTPEEKARIALDRLNRRYDRKGKPHEKPKVIVIRAQGKPLLVLCSGRKFVSAFTWDRLQYKVIYGPWQFIADTTLAKRLP